MTEPRKVAAVIFVLLLVLEVLYLAVRRSDSFSTNGFSASRVDDGARANRTIGKQQTVINDTRRYMFLHSSWEQFNAGRFTVADFAHLAAVANTTPVMPFLGKVLLL